MFESDGNLRVIKALLTETVVTAAPAFVPRPNYLSIVRMSTTLKAVTNLLVTAITSDNRNRSRINGCEVIAGAGR
jgi:hypothetical protein